MINFTNSEINIDMKERMNYVLMADIVGSRDSPDSKKLAKSFSDLISNCNELYKDEMISPLTITLGDEFQGVIKNECSAYKIISWIEENKWKKDEPINLRYVLELDGIETDINKDVAYGMMGPALTNARQNLTKLKEEDEWMGIGKKIENFELKSIQLNLYLLHIRNWKWSDKDLIAEFLVYQDYKVVAENLNKNTSLMWKRHKSLEIDKYFKLKRSLELLLC